MSAKPRRKIATQISILKSIRKRMPRPTQVVVPEPIKRRSKRRPFSRDLLWETE